ncbi:hypothetical protein ACFU1R_20430 [Priestia megaterium]|uniref:hypothetical protein n=1 Tax=Priestia megaterium TaxID=1404 RepID=UPI0036722590
MNAKQEANIQCFLYELKELSEKYGMFIESEPAESFIVTKTGTLIASSFRLNDDNSGYEVGV